MEGDTDANEGSHVPTGPWSHALATVFARRDASWSELGRVLSLSGTCKYIAKLKEAERRVERGQRRVARAGRRVCGCKGRWGEAHGHEVTSEAKGSEYDCTRVKVSQISAIRDRTDEQRSWNWVRAGRVCGLRLDQLERCIRNAATGNAPVT
ncbi:hypothetical protein OH77DRAFT_50324 [Trametes cingulata]|nr:hypothetical protein OH77DRAFT_50324 [Trametes cingulata]